MTTDLVEVNGRTEIKMELSLPPEVWEWLQDPPTTLGLSPEAFAARLLTQQHREFQYNPAPSDFGAE
jgi:hypothetical protein